MKTQNTILNALALVSMFVVISPIIAAGEEAVANVAQQVTEIAPVVAEATSVVTEVAKEIAPVVTVAPVVTEAVAPVAAKGWWASLKDKAFNVWSACTLDNTKTVASTVYSAPANLVNAGLKKARLDLANVEFFKNHTMTANIASHVAKTGLLVAATYGTYKIASALYNKFAGKGAQVVPAQQQAPVVQAPVAQAPVVQAPVETKGLTKEEQEELNYLCSLNKSNWNSEQRDRVTELVRIRDQK